MTTPELLPCPFCGSSHVRLIDPASGSGYLYILCEGCLSAGKQSKDSAVCIAAWNSRSARPDTRSEVLEEAARVAESFGDTWSNSRDTHLCVQEAAVDAKCEQIASAIRALIKTGDAKDDA